MLLREWMCIQIQGYAPSLWCIQKSTDMDYRLKQADTLSNTCNSRNLRGLHKRIEGWGQPVGGGGW
jgi:hypothetical protein